MRTSVTVLLGMACALMLAAGAGWTADLQPKAPAKGGNTVTFGSGSPPNAPPAPSSPIFGNASVWETVQAQAPSLVFHGTGSLGLSDTIKNWDTAQVQTAALVFHGTGSLGLSDTIKNWDTVQVQTVPLVFHGTGQLK